MDISPLIEQLDPAGRPYPLSCPTAGSTPRRTRTASEGAGSLGEILVGCRYSTEARTMRLERGSSRLYSMMLMLAAVVLLADQLTKLWAVSALSETERVAVIPR
ncbi:hypothetical protein ACFQYP_01695 [Nonomuraea antimicrobica]